MAKAKAGDLNVSLSEEEILWYDRKRWLLFGLPWTFTKYQLTKSKLMLNTGLFNQKEEEIRLYRITDVTYTQTLMERMTGTGTIKICSSDNSQPEIVLIHVKNAKKVKDVISQCVETARRENGVRTSELVGAHHAGDGHAHESFGPAIVPDTNHNGVDDRLE